MIRNGGVGWLYADAGVIVLSVVALHERCLLGWRFIAWLSVSKTNNARPVRL